MVDLDGTEMLHSGLRLSSFDLCPSGCRGGTQTVDISAVFLVVCKAPAAVLKTESLKRAGMLRRVAQEKVDVLGSS